MNASIPAIGSYVTTAEDFDLLPIGTVLVDSDDWTHTKVANYSDEDKRNGYVTTTYVTPEGETDTFGSVWAWGPGGKVVSIPDEVTPRPVRSLPHETQRQYALKARSRLLDVGQNAVLYNAAQGEPVDVFAFRQAATAALSLASTRAGQSMARRDWAREARALIHWADAILESHLDGLPVYAEGDRSRLIEALKADNEAIVAEVSKALNDAKTEIEDLTNEVGRLTAVASREAERRRDAEAEQRRSEISHEQTYASLADDYRALKADFEAQGGFIVRNAKVEGFARSLLDEVGRAKVEGFIEGLVS
jgi:F0F1-type ATP synthase membrane subunit b/b'